LVAFLSVTLRDFAYTEIRDILSRTFRVFTLDELVAKVLGSLKSIKRSEAAIASRGLFGIITLRDLLDVDQPNQTKLDSVWRATGSIKPQDNILSLCEFLVENRVRAIPVVEDGLVIGLATQMDVVLAMANVQELSEYKARELIKSPVWSLDVDKGITNVRHIMLSKGISHVPIVDKGRLVGVVTAEDIVNTFISPALKTTKGERVGKRTKRFPGKVSGIMDIDPCKITHDASILDVINALNQKDKNACFMTNPEEQIIGVLAPRDLMRPILDIKAPTELPVYIIGIADEDFFERIVAEDKIRRVVSKSRRFRPDITEVSVRIKRSQLSGERTRYELTGRAYGQKDQINAEAGGWDLLESFDILSTRLGEAIRRSKPQTPGRSRRRRSRR
jgi:CBS domain-containing protein/ribosome-associated translation inhibitor RaiA